MSRVPRSGAATATAAAALALAPAAAHACAVCGALGSDQNRLAFLAMTLFMTILPLALIAAGILWLARRGREALKDEFTEREDAAVPPVAGESGKA